MILTGSKIISEYKSGNIQIDPFDARMVNPNSYNYRLADTIYEITDNVLDTKKEAQIRKIIIPKEGYCLQPGVLYLGSTYEQIGSHIYSMQLIGRSSIGRLGLYLQITAPLGHVGTFHNWTLELKVVQPLIVYPKMKIGQVSFWCVYGENRTPYEGKYWKYSEPHISEFYKELEISTNSADIGCDWALNTQKNDTVVNRKVLIDK